MKFKIKKLLLAVLTVSILLQVLPLTASAASVSVSGSSSVTVGSTVSVKVTFSGTNIAAVQASFSYDSKILSYQSGDGTSNGKIVLVTSSASASSLSTTIKFKAVGVGSCKVSVSASTIYDYNESSLGSASGSKTITVTEKPVSTPKPTGTKNPNATTKPSATPTPSISQGPAIQVSVNGQTLYLCSVIPNITLPEEFVKVAYSYKGTSVEAAKDDGRNLLLLYLTDANQANGKFYIYDEKTNSFSEYIGLTVKTENYVISKVTDPQTVPKGFVSTKLSLGDQSVDAWKSAQNELNGFYLLYAMNDKGTAGFYLYDSSEGTMQRYTAETGVTTSSSAAPSLSSSPEKTQEVIAQPASGSGFMDRAMGAIDRTWGKITGDRDIFRAFEGLIGFCILLLIIIIMQSMKKKKLKKQIEAILHNSEDLISEQEPAANQSGQEHNSFEETAPSQSIEQVSEEISKPEEVLSEETKIKAEMESLKEALAEKQTDGEIDDTTNFDKNKEE